MTNYFFDCILFLKDKPEKKKWTFIHFANTSHMNIYPPMISTIRVFERFGGSGSNLYDIAYTSTGSSDPTLYYLKQPMFVPDKDPIYEGSLTPNLFSPHYVFNSHLKGQYEKDGDPGDYLFLEKMILNIAELYPSDSVALFIMDHGSGIDIDGTTKSISFNTDNGNTITMPQLRTVLENVKNKVNINLFVMDACFMGMFEVAYEFKDTGVKHIMASSRSSSAFFDPQIVSNPPTTLERIANGANSCTIGDVCHEFIAKHGSTTFSIYNMEKMDEFTALFNDFASRINQTPVEYTEPVLIRTTRMAIDDPFCKNYYDLTHFAKLISETHFPSDPANLVASAKALYEYLLTPSSDKFIFDRRVYEPEKYPNDYGVSVLIPAPNESYEQTMMDIYRKHKYYLDGNDMGPPSRFSHRGSFSQAKESVRLPDKYSH